MALLIENSLSHFVTYLTAMLSLEQVSVINDLEVSKGMQKQRKSSQETITAWMELETLTLSEVSRKEKDKYHMISFISGI